MMPAIGLIAIGRQRWPTVPLPLPLFPIWPLVLLALGAVALARKVLPESDARTALTIAHTAVLAFFQLSGLRIDVESADRTRVRMWLI